MHPLLQHIGRRTVTPLLQISPSGNISAQARNGISSFFGGDPARYQPAPGARINLCKNPSFETGTTGWNGQGGTIAQSTAWSYAGAASLLCTRSSGGVDQGANMAGAGGADVIPGTTYSASAWVYHTLGQAFVFYLSLWFYDETGAVQVGSAIVGTNVSVPSGVPTRVTMSGVAPSGCEKLRITVYQRGSSPTPVGANFFFDAVQIESGAVATDYFDGSGAPLRQPTPVWFDPATGLPGTANASASAFRALSTGDEATTNLLRNPGAEVDATTGMQFSASVVGTRDTTYAYIGTAAVKVVSTTVLGAGAIYTTASGLNYTGTVRTFVGSVYLRGAGQVSIKTVVYYTDASATASVDVVATLTDAWTRIVTGTVASDSAKTVQSIQLEVCNAIAAVQTWWMDAAQVEEKDHVTPYADGSLGTGFAWTGTAHASSSTRAAGTQRYIPVANTPINYSSNPSAETAQARWFGPVLMTAVRDSTQAYNGTWSMKCTMAAGGENLLHHGNIDDKSMFQGKTYTVSFWAYASGAAVGRMLRFQINEGGGPTSETLIGPSLDVVLVNGWQRIVKSGTIANLGRSYLHVLFRFPDVVGGEVVYLDAFQAEVGSVAAPYFDGSTSPPTPSISPGLWAEPSTGVVGTAHASPSISSTLAVLEAATTNVIPDPSFENATIATNWQISSAGTTLTRDNTMAQFGTNSAKLVCDGASASQGISQILTTITAQAAAASGQTWTLSFWARAATPADVGKVIIPYIIERDAANTQVRANQGPGLTLVDTWIRHSVTVQLAGGASTAKVSVNISLNAAVATSFFVDGVQLERQPGPTSYVDGTLGAGYAWVGIANSSSSTRANPNAAVRYLPMPNGRINLVKNPRFAAGPLSTYWLTVTGLIAGVVLDPDFGGSCLEALGSTSSMAIRSAANATSMQPIRAKVVHTFSFDAKLISGDGVWQPYVAEFDAGGGLISSANIGSAITVTSSIQRFSATYTPTGTSVHFITIGWRKGNNTLGIARFGNVVWEEGNLVRPPFFDGSPVTSLWFDPITGLPTPPNSGASVSAATTWQDEFTTNLVVNPSAENAAITTGIGTIGGGVVTLTKDAAYALFGAASAKTVTDGTAAAQGVVFNTASALNYTGTVRTFVGSIFVRGNGTIEVWSRIQNTDASVIDGVKTTVALNDTWQRIVPPTVASDSAKTVNLLQIHARTPTAGPAAAITFWADGAQIEERSTPTTFCDGSLGAGYAWTSTANASSSTRASGINRVLPQLGARVNYSPNPRLATDQRNWAASSVNATVSRVPDASLGGYALEVTSGTNNEGALQIVQVNAADMRNGTVITLSLDAYLISGASDWHIRLLFGDNVSNLSGGGIFAQFTPTATPGRYTASWTLSAPVGVQRIIFYVRRSSPVAGTIRFSNVTVEINAGSGPRPYFDGDSYPVSGNPATFLDPLTGLPGALNAAVSVSQSAIMVEEGTTNTVTDPSFEAAAITTGWFAAGAATISKDAAFAYLGAGSAKVVCTATNADGISQLGTAAGAAAQGQIWTASAYFRANTTADVGKQVRLLIVERDGANAFLVASASSPFLTLTDAWQRLTLTHTVANAATARVTLNVLNAAAVAVTFNVDACQLEQKGYVTSYCDGSLGNGYSWSGTAHASGSVRAAQIGPKIEPESAFLPPQRGSIVAWFQRIDEGPSFPTVMNAGSLAAGLDRYVMYVSQSSDHLSFAADANGVSCSLPAQFVTQFGVWYLGIGSWDSSLVRLDNFPFISNFRSDRGIPVGTADTTSGLQIGTVATGNALDGIIGSAAILDRVLTAYDRTKLLALGPGGITADAIKQPIPI